MKRSVPVYIAVLSLFLVQCTKEPVNNLTTEESRIYVTNYDTAALFSSYATFRIADSVANIENNRLVSKTLDETDAQIINAVRGALTQRGYSAAAGTGTADLGVTISAITNTSTQLISYNDYGGYYGGYWDPFYWGYSDFDYYFPTYYGLYESGETALSIDIIDLKNAAQNGNKLNVIWSGLIRGSGIFSATTINSQVAALFAQSPYLSKQ
jgi:hypothetical protein